MATQTHMKQIRARQIKYSGTIRLTGTISTTLAREIDAYGAEIGALTVGSTQSASGVGH